MTAFLDISAALDARLDALTGSPSIAWPNDKFKPVNGTLYLQPNLLPADVAPSTIGVSSTGGTDDHAGVYLINIFAPADEGKNEAYTMADSIADHFKQVTELTYNGRVVRCMNVSIAPALKDGDRWQVPVRINYTSHIAKR